MELITDLPRRWMVGHMRCRWYRSAAGQHAVLFRRANRRPKTLTSVCLGEQTPLLLAHAPPGVAVICSPIAGDQVIAMPPS
jgi:hypothetical protein